jgi:hypothetical protein
MNWKIINIMNRKRWTIGTYYIFLFISMNVSAQNNIEAYHNTIHNNIEVDLPAYHSILPNNNYSVNESTGSFSNAIHLHEIVNGNYSYPLTLNYYTSGFRPADQADRVGLGWNVSIGASISRVVNGLPDEHDLGYWFSDPIPNEPSKSYLYDVLDEKIDPKPDIFTYSLPSGKSGSLLSEMMLVIQMNEL